MSQQVFRVRRRGTNRVCEVECEATPGTAAHPFSRSPVETIPLDMPPLASVLVQVRFSPVLEVSKENLAGQVQKALREEYPFLSAETELAITFSPGADGPPAPMPTRLWRFASDDDTWRVTLASGFTSLETKAYAGHEDFFGRLRRVLTTVEEIVVPPAAERIGVRYTQRLTEPEDLARLPEFVRPEVLGASAVRDGDGSFSLCLTQAQTQFDDVTLSARWGLLAPDTGIDAVIPPLEEPNWLMDIDVFDERREPFDPAVLADRALAHSRRQYQFFRWAVEPAFLVRFGADQALVTALAENGTP
jgi:uncharacterized protein (TIGR04255 family)